MEHTPAGFSFRSVSRSHPGQRRAQNEDRVLDRAEDGLWAVADGMGGHRSGDVAAGRLVDALSAVRHGVSGYACLMDITREVERVNAGLLSEEGPQSATSVCGSTLVLLLVHENHYACLWAGDSRAYLFRDGSLAPITRDHSLVQQWVDAGAISEVDRRRHPQGHVITRAIGAGPEIKLDQYFAEVLAGDVFLLCSDGLTGSVAEGEIAAALRGADLSATADLMLDLALARGAPDNVSFILVGVDA